MWEHVTNTWMVDGTSAGKVKSSDCSKSIKELHEYS